MRPFLQLTFLVLATGLSLLTHSVNADELEVVISGVEEPMLSNVRAFVEPFRLTGSGRLNKGRRDALRLKSETDAAAALRPFGFYHAQVQSRLSPAGERSWRLEVDIKPGPPVRVSAVEIDVDGPGALIQGLLDWKKEWPLAVGRILVQPEWEQQKQRALNIANDNGYLLARFSSHSMKIDLERNEARLELVLETGPQAVMGEVRFDQDIVKPEVMTNLPRFVTGDPYNAWLMERFRIDLWQAGYFRNVEIVEDRHMDELPPRVDLDIRAAPRPRNTYQATVGIGSDTGARLLFSWNRHLISRNGDSFSLGTGWQDHNDEFFVRGGYRIPRTKPKKTRQFWIADVLLKRENEDVRVSDSSDDEILYRLGNADVTDYSVKPGRLKVYNIDRGYRQLFETLYAQYLYETVDYRIASEPGSIDSPIVLAPGEIRDERGSETLSLGIDFELPYSRGQGFDLVGHNHRAWAFVSNEAWGSDRDFAQVYLSTRWNLRAGKRWKLLLRGELGYSNADVRDEVVEIEGREVTLSVTSLPNLYRFKAGGSSSVRGYGFESLSDSNIGSNNVVTASVEAEMRVMENWSLAAFVDVGNAFNDWSKPNLKTGWGVGLRWYSIAGAIRVDLAQGLNLPDKPWQVHFTIGTSLL